MYLEQKKRGISDEKKSQNVKMQNNYTIRGNVHVYQTCWNEGIKLNTYPRKSYRVGRRYIHLIVIST